MADDLQYCPRCGAPLIVRLLPTEDRPRLVCDRGHILYVNPKLIVGVIPERQRQILLMRRGIEPRYGFWTYPGGYMEIDESVEECAVREAEEEIGVKVEIGDSSASTHDRARTGRGSCPSCFEGRPWTRRRRRGGRHLRPAGSRPRIFRGTT